MNILKCIHEKKHSSESIKKITLNNKMRGNPSPRRKMVTQYNLSGVKIKDWSYVSEAEIYYNKLLNLKYKGLISMCCNNKIKSAYGYKWEHK